MIRTLISTLLLFLFLKLSGQNLVPNPSFEKGGRIFPFRTLEDVKKWTAPGRGSSDYYKEKNSHGRIDPHSGSCFVAIGTFDIGSINQEYLQAKLLHKLQANKKYCVSMFLRRSSNIDESYALDKFEVTLTKGKVRSRNRNIIEVDKYLDLTNGNPLLDSKNWTELCTTFIATGDEKFITIGKFDRNFKLIPILSKKGKPQGNFLSAYYFIDDISLIELNEQNGKCDCSLKKDGASNQSIAGEDTVKSFDLELNKSIVLNNISFEIEKSELLPQSFAELDKLVNYLIINSKTKIEISGHTDNTGNEEQNKKLSEARAKAVADYLNLKNIDNTRITYKGYGSLKPIASNDNDIGRQQNRRVEFVINKN